MGVSCSSRFLLSNVRQLWMRVLYQSFGHCCKSVSWLIVSVDLDHIISITSRLSGWHIVYNFIIQYTFPNYITQTLNLYFNARISNLQETITTLKFCATYVIYACLTRVFCQTKLQAVVDRGTGRGARLGRPCAGKTGTSDGHRDAWFAGFTPMLSCVVRVHHLLKIRLFLSVIVGQSSINQD